ncbi:hypothetical protein PPACK8108_LOCUS18437 [Phakopsora pachyrhizi]|uniref:Uncharacterized protein n=1 Tax=Phakopsora pachyrhizi TaxID=170000 RepID=A0AAV0BD48_PHAPC|nr:hypothetical protein PPACK8108_LOCUS18437 [Phakopsora pachyrhizi]
MRVLELANDQTANRGEQLLEFRIKLINQLECYNVLRYGKSSYNRGSVDGHGKSYNVRMGVVFEDQSNLDTPVERIKDNKSLDCELKNQVDGSREGTVEPAGLGMSFDCFNGDWKWHTTVTINKALINQMRLDILVDNQLKDEIYKPFELLDPDQRLEGSYDVQTIGGKVWRNLCWITSRVTLERARNIFDSNYLEKNWEVDPNREIVDLVSFEVEDRPSKIILRLPTMPYGHSSRKRDGDNTRDDLCSKWPMITPELKRSEVLTTAIKGYSPRADKEAKGQVFFARVQLENGRDIEGERVEVSRMKRMRMEVKTTYIYKAMNGESASVVVDVSDGVFAMIGAVEGYRQSWSGIKVGSGMAKDTKRMGVMEEAQQLLCSSRRQSETLGDKRTEEQKVQDKEVEDYQKEKKQ